MKKYICILCTVILPLYSTAQLVDTTEEEYIRNIQRSYDRYKKNIEKQYSDYLRDMWEQYNAYAPVEFPKKDIEPVVRDDNEDINSIKEIHIDRKNILDIPSPIDTINIYLHEPINNKQRDNIVNVILYGINLEVQRPKALPKLCSVSNDDIANAWEELQDGRFNQTLYDCLKIKQEMNLCDWAYANLLNNTATSIYPSSNNESALLFAYLLDKSGYDMRISRSNSQVIILIACEHEVYRCPYLVIDDSFFYPFMTKCQLDKIYICNVPTQNKKKLSLFIDHEQYLGDNIINKGTITATYGITINISVPINKNLLDFYTSYPTSRIHGDDMTRWAMYAQTPIDKSTRIKLYNQLSKYISGKSQVEAANILLNFVQTGFKYKYDDEVWGEDRAFFAEETLYYPYCDCEDRSILFSHLIRDLLGLDIALVYTPGHLFTAVNFTESTTGAYIVVNNKKFTICEPTCTNGAPVGWSSLKKNYDGISLIVLDKIQYD